MIIKKVYENNSNKQLLVSIPKKEGIKKGDYVKIEKVDQEDKGEIRK